jgi:hypothetical protein
MMTRLRFAPSGVAIALALLAGSALAYDPPKAADGTPMWIKQPDLYVMGDPRLLKGVKVSIYTVAEYPKSMFASSEPNNCLISGKYLKDQIDFVAGQVTVPKLVEHEAFLMAMNHGLLPYEQHKDYYNAPTIHALVATGALGPFCVYDIKIDIWVDVHGGKIATSGEVMETLSAEIWQEGANLWSVGPNPQLAVDWLVQEFKHAITAMAQQQQ